MSKKRDTFTRDDYAELLTELRELNKSLRLLTGAVTAVARVVQTGAAKLGEGQALGSLLGGIFGGGGR